MKKQTIAALACLGFALPGYAAEHRLAFSQASQLQVFIEHTDNSDWCSEHLNMRFQDPGAANLNTLEQMMPRLGALIGRECPVAKQVDWKSIDADNSILQSGSTTAMQGWALNPPSTETAQIAAAEDTEPTASASAKNAGPGPEKTAKIEAEEETAKPDTANIESRTSAESTVPVLQPEPKATQEAVAKAERTAESTTELSPLATETTNTTATAVQSAPLNFAIAGWQPRTTNQTLAVTKFSSPLRDQNSCLFNTNYSFDVLPEYMQVSSEKVACDSDGLASGEGTLHVTRTDGQSLGSIAALWHKGLPFTSGKPEFEIQHINHGNSLLGLLHSDPVSMNHYLIEASSQRSGAWSLGQPRVIVLTQNSDQFRDAAAINAINDIVLRETLKLVDSDVSTIRILAVNSLDETLTGNMRNNDSWLYDTSLNRGWRGPWQASQHPTNHLFEREARQARERAIAEQREKQEREITMRRQAEAQAGYLRTFQELVQKPVVQRINEWIKEPAREPEYRQLLRGGTFNYQQIVRINGAAGDAWEVSKPYPALLRSDKKLAKGWYRVNGNLSLDAGTVDKDGLPMSIINTSQIDACKDESCTELFDPITIVAAMSGQPDWSEEAARNLIERVENGQFE